MFLTPVWERVSGCHFIKCLMCHHASFPDRTGKPTRTGRAAPVTGPVLGPRLGPVVGPVVGLWPGTGPGPAVAGVWPGMFSRLNLGTTATLTLRLGRAWRGDRTSNCANICIWSSELYDPWRINPNYFGDPLTFLPLQLRGWSLKRSEYNG